MITIKLTEEAEKELGFIIEYIARDNPERARTFTKEMLKKAFDLLEVFPKSKPFYDEAKQIRLFPYEKYNLFYRFDEDIETVYIVHILNSAKLTDTLF